MWENIILGIVPTISMLLIAPYIMKKAIRQEYNFIVNDLKQRAEGWVNSQEGQTALMQIGQVAISGVTKDVSKVMPKFKMQDMLGLLIYGLAQKSGLIPQMPMMNPEQQQQQQPQPLP